MQWRFRHRRACMYSCRLSARIPTGVRCMYMPDVHTYTSVILAYSAHSREVGIIIVAVNKRDYGSKFRSSFVGLVPCTYGPARVRCWTPDKWIFIALLSAVALC